MEIFKKINECFSIEGELRQTGLVLTNTKPRAEVLNFTPLLLTSAPFFFLLLGIYAKDILKSLSSVW
jgi:hypothetical protein